jgi:hypothetical protein
MLEEFDVFLSHTSQDRLLVEAIAAQLKARGIRAWLDGRLLKKLGHSEDTVQARLAELRQGLPPSAPAPLCTPPPD